MNLKKVVLLIMFLAISIISCGNVTPIMAAIEADNAAFLEACANGDPALVANWLENGIDINAVNDSGESGLMLACSKRHIAIVLLLLEQEGLKVNMTDQEKATALHQASAKNYSDIALLLLEHGADLNQKDAQGQTPLLVACQKGNLATVKVLLAKGAKMDERDPEGKTPLHYVSANGHGVTLAFLLESQPELSIADYMGATALHAACKEGWYKLVEKLITSGSDVDSCDRNGKTPLFYACSTGRKITVEALLKRGADLSAEDNQGGSALHYACYHGQDEVAELLMEKGIVANNSDSHGITPLHLACYQGQEIIVEKLLEKGVNVNVLDELGRTPLDIAQNASQSEIVELLIEKGAKKGTAKKAFNPYFYQNYQIDKVPVQINGVSSAIENIDSSFWKKTDFPNTEQIYCDFYVYIDDWEVNRKRIKQASIISPDDTWWQFSREELNFKDGYLFFTNLYTHSLAKDNTIFYLRGLKVEIVTYDGRVDCYQVDIPEPGRLTAGKKYVYSPSYRAEVNSDYVRALETAKISSAIVTSQMLNLSFKVNDWRVYNCYCYFYNQNREYIGESGKLIDPYSRRICQSLNQGQSFYTNGQINSIQLEASEIEFETNQHLADIRYVMVILQDGVQFKNSGDRDNYNYASRSRMFPCKIEE